MIDLCANPACRHGADSNCGNPVHYQFKQYLRKNISEMRDYIPGEDLTGVSVSDADKALPTLNGGKIARNPTNHADTWYVAKVWFEDNFTPA